MPSKFRYEVLEEHYDPIGDPNEFYVYEKADFVMNIRPRVESEVIMTETLVDDQVYYRKRLKSRIQLHEDAYDYFRARVDECKRYWLNIYKKCENVETLIIRAWFTHIHFEWDDDACIAYLEPQYSSIYECIEKRRNIVNDVYAENGTTGGTIGTMKYFPGDVDTIIAEDLFFVVQSVIQKMNCRGYENTERMIAVQPVSDFFNWQKTGIFLSGIELTQSVIGDINASGPPTLTPIANYVNPSMDPYYIAIAQKSNIVNHTGSLTTPAWSFKMTFAELEKMMREVFNVYWILEPEFFIRFEHFSYFFQNVNYNAINATNFPLNKLKNKFKIEKLDYPNSETFKFSEASNTHMVGEPITYPRCSNGQDIERGIEKGTADFEFITNNPAITNLDGYVLFDVYESSGVWYLRQVTSYLTALNKANCRLGWGNVLKDLHMHNRPFTTGEINSTSETFLSPVYKREQVDIKVKLCCEDEHAKEDSLVRTELGDGKIDEAEINYTKEQIKFKLRHT